MLEADMKPGPEQPQTSIENHAVKEIEILSERDDEVDLFKVLPESATSGTSYEYYQDYPLFPEEIYYLLECASRENADPEEVIQMCRAIMQERNKELYDKFNNTPDVPNEMKIELEELDYSHRRSCINNNINILQL